MEYPEWISNPVRQHVLSSIIKWESFKKSYEELENSSNVYEANILYDRYKSTNDFHQRIVLNNSIDNKYIWTHKDVLNIGQLTYLYVVEAIYRESICENRIRSMSQREERIKEIQEKVTKLIYLLEGDPYLRTYKVNREMSEHLQNQLNRLENNKINYYPEDIPVFDFVHLLMDFHNRVRERVKHSEYVGVYNSDVKFFIVYLVDCFFKDRVQRPTKLLTLTAGFVFHEQPPSESYVRSIVRESSLKG